MTGKWIEISKEEKLDTTSKEPLKSKTSFKVGTSPSDKKNRTKAIERFMRNNG